MRQFWRQWLRGPKYGLARGVAVHGSPGFRKDTARLTDLLANCRKLQAWAQEHDVDPTRVPILLRRSTTGSAGRVRRCTPSAGTLTSSPVVHAGAPAIFLVGALTRPTVGPPGTLRPEATLRVAIRDDNY